MFSNDINIALLIYRICVISHNSIVQYFECAYRSAEALPYLQICVNYIYINFTQRKNKILTLKA